VLPAIAAVISLEIEFEAALDAQPAVYEQPEGRAPKEKVWEATTGTWVDIRWAHWQASVFEKPVVAADVSETTVQEETTVLQKAQERWTKKQNLDASVCAEINALSRELINPPMGQQPGSVTSMLQVKFSTQHSQLCLVFLALFLSFIRALVYVFQFVKFDLGCSLCIAHAKHNEAPSCCEHA
jgi:hypothetical protein